MPADPAKDYYDILGVPRNATPEQIKASRRKLIRQNHPDQFDGLRRKYEKTGDADLLKVLDEKIAQANEATKQVNQAYDVLSDSDKRAAYDRGRTSGSAGTASTPSPRPKPRIVLSTGSLDFGSVTKGDSKTRSFTIENHGGMPNDPISIDWEALPAWGELVIEEHPTNGFPITVTVDVKSAKVAAGSYTGRIVVIVDGAAFGVAVSMKIVMPGVAPSAVSSGPRPPTGAGLPRAAVPVETAPSVLISLAVILAIFAVVMFALGTETVGPFNFAVDQATLTLRFVFVIIGLLIAFATYSSTRDKAAWDIGTREALRMVIGAALYAVFSWLFNGTVFVVPSLSQVSLRPAIAIPMFFGYAFGPIVGFFTGAVGNMFGDALTGFGLSPQWSIGNGLVGFIAGLPMLFKDKKRSIDTVLWLSGALAVLTVALFFLNHDVTNGMYFAATEPVSIFAGLTILIGFALVVIVRFVFGSNPDVAAAVTWGMLGNIIGILFAALSDIWINGFSLAAAVVGEFLPAAGPNLIVAAILVPLLVGAYAAVQRKSGR